MTKKQKIIDNKTWVNGHESYTFNYHVYDFVKLNRLFLLYFRGTCVKNIKKDAIERLTAK